MSQKKASFIFTLMFIIPYICAVSIIGVAYNVLVAHASSPWRILVGTVVGTTMLYFLKIPLERPLRILGKYTFRFNRRVIRLFMLDEAKSWKKYANILIDAAFSLFGILAVGYLSRGQSGYDFISSTLIGWIVVVLFASLCISSYFEFDALAIK
ncbi:hypothetical protein [Lacticaseibacillus sharpeae]|uniref:Uncharacterized protein n=1 Tax=Lacticaseibacillus sharpeae JCM 1186 = DSM 20505 TaxID=1291052 RepID=A0A0R1ZIS8_9LACO|nr:hypothetical protein [Lacticaseibacillus sharpeae]KRM54856.1 hypothetical protein FC18_GL002274 [Lacticaseibacillus sharpeae JCM 1186 = DSM 20505]